MYLNISVLLHKNKTKRIEKFVYVFYLLPIFEMYCV